MLPQFALCLVLAFSGPLTLWSGLALFVGVTWVLSAVLLGMVHETEHRGKRWVVRAMVFVAFWVCTTVVYEML